MRFRNAQGQRIRLDSGARLNDDHCCCATCDFTTQVEGTVVAVTYTGLGGSSFSWDWGDGSPPGIGSSAAHLYLVGGSKTITLTVDGNVTCSRQINIPVSSCPQCNPGVPGNEATLVIPAVTNGQDAPFPCSVCSQVGGTKILSTLTPCNWRTTQFLSECRACRRSGVWRLVLTSAVYNVSIVPTGTAPNQQVIVRATISFGARSSSTDDFCINARGTYEKLLGSFPSSTCIGAHTLTRTASASENSNDLCTLPQTVQAILS